MSQSNAWMVQNMIGNEFINESELESMKYAYANAAEAPNETVPVSFKVPKYVVISDEKNIYLGWFDFSKKFPSMLRRDCSRLWLVIFLRFV